MKSSLTLAAALAMTTTATTGFAPSLTPYYRSSLIWAPGAGANKGKKTAKDKRKAKRKAKLAYQSKRRNRK